ncbi:bifunctional oligoribonuclease/PAP phosphatase NrnA [Candidatus Parcubacteria bacterium]|nr:bifunctional oligoribonuclease/PAP phosphatase NrnA [Patescibacteria group bacterium]MBU4309808.1 bifunctional oligoribonuclease/PAP phosphatase NrnA [Patescibacteria group bacterium]MBU4432204.1 bifunctional oligoribonuclease/PAP phosphatase NrnA [Patescibacteria group bacterium]MBU4578147.1 bifunctional oligoribonuclease/PAP phosphatase NrnA [Patescibacteria group bacterium]MCG2696684.1 bifunctional oligoribonuclease/PAP phosphatase NrnA [Candidatus Parcubacteria bacterium]
MIEEKYREAYEKIKGARNVLVVTHYRPDGDALSSMGIMIELLESLHKKYHAFCSDAPPFQFNFLPHVEKIKSDRDGINFADFDLFIALDCGSLSRTNLTKEIGHRHKDQIAIEFDHHPKIDSYSNIEVRNAKASSTAEVLYFFLKANKVRFNKNFANCILTGILTDTGNLLYESTSEKTIKITSEMLVYGARYPMILENTWRNKSLLSMRVWGRAMSNLKINSFYNFAYSFLTKDDIKNSGVTEEELEGIPGFLSNLAGVKALVFMREEEGGKIKGSLRTTHPDVDISKLAQVLGGGGHKRASGFVVDGKFEEVDGNWRIV